MPLSYSTQEKKPQSQQQQHLEQQATMTPPPLPSISGSIQTTSASSTAEAAAAAATTEPPPPPTASTSTEDPHDECMLCCYPLPRKKNESGYYPCCGEVICNGCIIAQKRTLVIGTNVKKPIKGSKEEELEFIAIFESKQIIVCPFCRAKKATNSKEFVKRLWKRIDEYNDPRAMRLLGGAYLKGEQGLSKNLKKTKELYQRAYDLGDLIAARNLFVLYTNNIPDSILARKYLEEGAQRGHVHCMAYLADIAFKSGNYEAAARQYMIAARSGDDQAMHNLMVCYRDSGGSVVSKEDLATTLHAHKAANDKRKSEPREYAMRHKTFEEKNYTVAFDPKYKRLRRKKKGS